MIVERLIKNFCLNNTVCQHASSSGARREETRYLTPGNGRQIAKATKSNLLTELAYRLSVWSFAPSKDGMNLFGPN